MKESQRTFTLFQVLTGTIIQVIELYNYHDIIY